MCKYIKLTEDRKKTIDQFKITDRDEHIYKSLDEAVEDALSRSFKDINFRTLHEKSECQKLVEKLRKNTIEQSETPCAFCKESKMVIEIFKEGQVPTITNYLIARLKKADFVKNFVVYFSDEMLNKLNESLFDAWHHEACTIFLDILQKYYPDAEYGKAQKIINMMFKHLYCMNFGENKSDWLVLNEKYFEHCHLTLDSFTLEWFWREIGERNNIKGLNNNYKIIKGKIDQWSNLQFKSFEEDVISRTQRLKKYGTCEDSCLIIVKKEKKQTSSESNNDSKEVCERRYHYMFFIDIIREFFSKSNTNAQDENKSKGYNSLTPFQAEFYIWPEIQLHLTAEALFGQSIEQESMKEELIEYRKIKNATEIKEIEEKINNGKAYQYEKDRLADLTNIKDMNRANALYKKMPLEEKISLLQQKIDLILKYCNNRKREESSNGT